ncbi:NUDIX hydrolase [Bifidobacterium leontopitheci]|uniref:Phosphohydrolase n=1 Tax=Bifidobacterium leontopitheci TaxID=2650774 RepID=A0A6I1GDB2_9BIFI|nr:NUDIX hydrolase [Bifidobacterium leontopitheci]KAB7789614.1 phosphohydrolase [Bifidobacterium leontopitheci]
MITPADLARMLAHVAGNHTQNAPDPLEPDTLLYSSTGPRPQLQAAAQDTAQDPVQAASEAASPTPSAPAAAVPAASIPPTSIPATPAMPTPATIAMPSARPKPHPGLHHSPRITAQITTRGMKTLDAPAGPCAPTPAMMPPRRSGDGPTTFASLDAQELPVVREYSAGGLVFDDRGRVAIIARHSRNGHLEWCLPKGHIEKGETPQQTAVREVHEETGILGEVVESIATIDYWFTGTSQRVHKLVHHFALRKVGGELTVEGDPDHEAEDAIWVDFEDLDDVLSYPNERKIAWLYARKMKQV